MSETHSIATTPCRRSLLTWEHTFDSFVEEDRIPTLSITEIAARYGVSPTFLLEAFRHLQLASPRDSEDSYVDGYYLDFFARRWADRLRRMT
ncbi:hypothetical protein, partial [Nocardioides sp. GCM10030258]